MTSLSEEEVEERRLVLSIFPGAAPVKASAIGGAMTVATDDMLPVPGRYSRGVPSACMAPMCADTPHYTIHYRADGRAWCALALIAEECWNRYGVTWVKPSRFREVRRAPADTNRMCIGGPLNGQEIRYRWLRVGVSKGRNPDRDFFGELVSIHHLFAHRTENGLVYGATAPQPAPMLGVYVLRDEAFHYAPSAFDIADRGAEAPAVPPAPQPRKRFSRVGGSKFRGLQR